MAGDVGPRLCRTRLRVNGPWHARPPRSAAEPAPSCGRPRRPCLATLPSGHQLLREPMMYAHLGRLGRRRRGAVVGAVALTLAASGAAIASAATPPPAHTGNTVGLKQVGPIDESNGFPSWYRDTNGVRLELCLTRTTRTTSWATSRPHQAGVLPGQLPGRGVLVVGGLVHRRRRRREGPAGHRGGGG